MIQWKMLTFREKLFTIPEMNTKYDKINAARDFARAGHDSINQRRKYTGVPYWTHTEEVAKIVSSVTSDEEMIIAALFHDLVEDVNVYPYNLQGITERFGAVVAGYIEDLTDVYTKENYPELNRKQRKEQEARRLANVHANSQTVKLADLISNTRDIVANDPNFARKYLAEKEVILRGLLRGDKSLLAEAHRQLEVGKKKLGMN